MKKQDSYHKENSNKEGLILLVDDDDSLLKFFKIHLNKFFPKIFVSKSAQEALTLLSEQEIDLIVTDYNMPKMNGVSFVKKVQKEKPHVPILFISGADISEEKLKEIILISDGILRKPFSVDDFNSFITLGLEIRSSMREVSGLIKANKQNKIRSLLQNKESASDFVEQKDNLKILLIHLQQIEKLLERIKKVASSS